MLLNTKATIWVRELTMKALCFLLNIPSLRSISRWTYIKNHVFRSNLNRSILKVLCWTLFKYFGQLPSPAMAVLDSCVNQTWYYFETLEADLWNHLFLRTSKKQNLVIYKYVYIYIYTRITPVQLPIYEAIYLDLLMMLGKNMKNKTYPPKWQKKFDGDLPAIKNHTKHKSKVIRVITLFITSWWLQPTWKNMSQICRNLPPHFRGEKNMKPPPG